MMPHANLRRSKFAFIREIARLVSVRLIWSRKFPYAVNPLIQGFEESVVENSSEGKN